MCSKIADFHDWRKQGGTERGRSTILEIEHYPGPFLPKIVTCPKTICFMMFYLPLYLCPLRSKV